MKTIYEFRCTRNALYTGNCPGASDIRERQGYYVNARSLERAKEIMAARFPEDAASGLGFTADQVKVAFHQFESIK